jgi:hypothetical protein
MISTLVSILIFILIAALVLWFCSYILSLLPLNPTLKNICLAIIALLLLLIALQRFGILAGLG